MPARRLPLLALGALAALVAAALATAGAPARSQATKTIATATTGDFRVVVAAARTSSGSAPTARVTVTTFERASSGWRRTGARALAEPYFWKTLSSARSVCRLELRTAGAGARFRPRAVVQLLQSPSLGCGPATSHPLARSR